MENRLAQVSEILSGDHTTPAPTVEALLDIFVALYADFKTVSNQTEYITGFLAKYEKLASRLQTLRINTTDFENLKTLATGAVGKVSMVRYKHNNKIYAMKTLKKTDLLSRREAAFYMEERDALVKGKGSEWITSLFAAFQDEENLYLVMEYACGGSLRAMMNNRETVMTEAEARFYFAEILIALDELHRMNFIHRDLKPENCLVDNTGHLKLADFGSCVRLGDKQIISSQDTVGTPDYISPEILRAQEGKATYGIECDWWSLGIVLYEMLFDDVPFYADSLAETYGKIMDHERTFSFPEDAEETSTEAKDLITKLICSQDTRLGKKGIDDIMSHAWFKGFDWDAIKLRRFKPPFIPALSHPEDTRYFEDEDNESKKVPMKALNRTKDYTGQSLSFIGYTFVKETNPEVIFSRDGKTVSTVVNTSVTSEITSVPTRVSVPARNSVGPSFVANTQELESLREQVRSFNMSKTSAEEELTKLRAELLGESTRVNQLKTSVEVSQRKQQQLEDMLVRAQTLKEKEIAKKEEVERELARVQKALDDELRRQSDLASRQMQSSKELEAVKLDLEKVKSESENDQKYKNLYMEAQSLIETLQKQIEEMRIGNTNTTSALQSLKDELATIQSDHDALVFSNEDLLRKFSEMESDCQVAIQRLEAERKMRENIEKENSVTKEQMKLVQEEVTLTRAQREEVEAQYIQIQRKVEELETQVGLKDTKISNLIDRITELSHANVALEEAIQQKETAERLREERERERERLETERKEREIAEEAARREEELRLAQEEEEARRAAESKAIKEEDEEEDGHATPAPAPTFTRISTTTANGQKEVTVQLQEPSPVSPDAKHTVSTTPVPASPSPVVAPQTPGSIHERANSQLSTVSHQPSVVSTATPKKGGKWMNILFKTHSQSSRHEMPAEVQSTANNAAAHDSASISQAQPEPISKQNSILRKASISSGLRRRMSTSQSNRSRGSAAASPTSESAPSESTELRGWIKVPKGGKVKKGWKLKFAVVKDNKVFIYDKEKDAEQNFEGVVVGDLSTDVFIVRGVNQTELIHASGKDVDCIFKIHTAPLIPETKKASDDLIASIPELHDMTVKKKIDKLEQEIQLEESMLQAAEKMWAVSTETNKQTLNTPIMASQQRLRTLKEELESVTSMESLSKDTKEQIHHKSLDSVKELAERYRPTVELNLQEDVRKLQALQRMTPTKELRQEIEQVEASIKKQKDDLVSLTQGGAGATDVIAHLREVIEGEEVNGHFFKLRRYYKATDCAVCREPLWGATNEGLECTSCHSICHKSCKGMNVLSCRQVRSLQQTAPLYFMTETTAEKLHWVNALEQKRKEYERTRPTRGQTHIASA